MEKLARYEDLVADCKKAGWKTHLFAVEVGARGYASQSLLTLLNKLGIQRRSSKRMITNISDCALRCSFWIWLKKTEEVWINRTDAEEKVERQNVEEGYARLDESNRIFFLKRKKTSLRITQIQSARKIGNSTNYKINNFVSIYIQLPR